jgi:hypothetical protein
MIKKEFKNIKSGSSELRKFGLTFGIILAVLGGFFLWREKNYYPHFLLFSAVFIFAGLVLPVLLKPIYTVWMRFAVLMGWFMTRVILSFLFYMIVTPIGLAAKVFGKDFLQTRFDKHANSYWIPKERVRSQKSDYERQF